MLDVVRQMYHKTRALHAEGYGLIVAVKRALAGSTDKEELVDTIYACKRAEEMTQDLGKELRKVMEHYKRLCCLQWVAEMTGDPIRTKHCTGTPSTKVTYLQPKKGTAEYAELCKHYGVDPDGPFAPHWKRMIEAMTDLAQRGHPPPPGIDPSASVTIFEVATRQKAGSSIEQPIQSITREDIDATLASTVDDSMAMQLENALRSAFRVLPYATLSLTERRALIRDAAIRVSQACSDEDFEEVKDVNDTPW